MKLILAFLRNALIGMQLNCSIYALKSKSCKDVIDKQGKQEKNHTLIVDSDVLIAETCKKKTTRRIKRGIKHEHKKSGWVLTHSDF